MKTTYSNGYYGHTGETRTETDANGKLWELSTMKRHNGKITSTARQVTDEGGGSTSYVMFQDKSIEILSTEGKATEKKIRETHEAAILKFLDFLKEQPAPVEQYKIEIGQVLFTDGYDNEVRRAIYEIVRAGKYKTVLLDGTDTRHDEHVRPYSEKFGIGVYYNEGDKISPEQVNELLNKAREAKAERARVEEETRQAAARVKAEKIAKGSEIIKAIPAGVEAVIIAQRFSTTYDPYADYGAFQDHTEETIYLAFSTHKRDLFDEMRKAAEKYEPTAHMGRGKGIFETFETNADQRICERGPVFTTEAEAISHVEAKNAEPNAPGYKWTYREDEIEHREKYSMGSGYYMKSGDWKIRKSNIDARSLPDLQIAAAEGRFFCNTQPEATTEAPNLEPIEVKAGTVQIIEYGRGLAIIGDTRPIAEKLGKKGLGLIFQPRLTCGPGWIAPKSRLEEIQKALSKPAAVQAPDPESIPDEPTPEEAEAIREEIKVKKWVQELKDEEDLTRKESEAIADNFSIEENAKKIVYTLHEIPGGNYKGKRLEIHYSKPGTGIYEQLRVKYGRKENLDGLHWSGAGEDKVYLQGLHAGSYGDIKLECTQFADILQKIGFKKEIEAFEKAWKAWRGEDETTEATNSEPANHTEAIATEEETQPEKFNYEFYTGLKTNYNPITGQRKQPAQIAGTNVNEDEAKDKKFLESLPDYTPETLPIEQEPAPVKEIGTSSDGFFRVSGPQTQSQRERDARSIEARRIESDQRKTGRSNTALPAPQMFITF